MTTKALVVLAFWIAAAVLLLLVGFGIVTSREWNLVALGIAAYVVGEIINLFWANP